MGEASNIFEALQYLEDFQKKQTQAWLGQGPSNIGLFCPLLLPASVGQLMALQTVMLKVVGSCLTASPGCPICGAVETVQHLLFECTNANNLDKLLSSAIIWN